MSAYTPGPWRFVADYVGDEGMDAQEVPLNYVGPGYFGNPRIIGSNGSTVVGCDEYYVFSGAANVSLICAAPVMADALRRIFDHYGPPQEHDERNPYERACECLICEIQRERDWQKIIGTMTADEAGDAV